MLSSVVSSSVSSALYKRATEPGSEPNQYELPSWTWLVVLLGLAIVFPALLWLDYTVEKVWPVFAMVEDENPPPYEPVALDDSAAVDTAEPVMHGESGAVSSSARGIHRLLMANGGIRANFRGFFCLAAQVLLTVLLMGFFVGTLGPIYTPLATLIASLTLVQFSTAWVHIIITRPSELHFWSRLPPFSRTFNATWQAVCLFWFATEIHRGLPRLLVYVFNLQNPGLVHPRDLDSSLAWGVPVIVITSLLSFVFIIIPAQVVLIRVQASLLPADAETIISFDRSFQGLVEPAIASGKGYATISQAWATFSRAAWRRLVILYAKIFVIGIATITFLSAIILPLAAIVFVNTKKIN
ncbi:hypothetical protein S40285_00941 [Stachybotrys chlorohalonatus IBT 40285]|uniref:Ubiquitin carrier protein n=1 Tax=Stachybotrys chlorohalonatus (strain IBT 40285) TaxID=1283841 RepID=A0A084QUU7_STAC4|nr:hypothetical protein S40285_00941 [Stachybotrys chlorohalonata IBT 40285]